MIVPARLGVFAVLLAAALVAPGARAADLGCTAVDGAKGEETIIQVQGLGPATATPAETR